MTALAAWAVIATVTAGVLWLRLSDARSRLRMPELPPSLPKAKRKRKRR